MLLTSKSTKSENNFGLEDADMTRSINLIAITDSALAEFDLSELQLRPLISAIIYCY